MNSAIVLTDRKWLLKYSSFEGDLVNEFYVPALKYARRYDRLTGYFSASALTLASRGIEGLIRNGGRMRLVVGCTLGQPEIEAIEHGERVRTFVEGHLERFPLVPADSMANNALELLAWMVSRETLDVKIAVPCDNDGMPMPDDSIFHEKTGIIEDKYGNKLAWSGSLNETVAGWKHNWEGFSVYTSWGPEPGRVNHEEVNFQRIWGNEAPRLRVFCVPEAVRRDLMRFDPGNRTPKRLMDGRRKSGAATTDRNAKTDTGKENGGERLSEFRSRVWSFIENAPNKGGGGQRIGEATSPVDPWPHQQMAYQRLSETWPPKLLIADEVGLGKTIQAGMFLRQAWLSRKASRILILAPKAVLKQWQIELREKFNLNWPIYDGAKLVWLPSPAVGSNYERKVHRKDWHREPAVIVSSQLMRRDDRANELVHEADPWDVLVLDEAHHARRRGAGSQHERGPNSLLKLMLGLKERTQGIILLTATPMQVHPVEVWDLLNLLGLPAEWTDIEFVDFFNAVDTRDSRTEIPTRLATLFQSTERMFGKMQLDNAMSVCGLSRSRTNKILRALRDQATIPLRQLDSEERRGAKRILVSASPIHKLVSRNTRRVLRRYFKEGLITTPIAERSVEDCFLSMTAEERAIYGQVEGYISNVYNKASERERTAVGFVMTIYRRRLASSFAALQNTLFKRRSAIEERWRLDADDEDASDDEIADDIVDSEEVEELGYEALANEEVTRIDRLVAAIGELPPDSKLDGLKNILRKLRDDGFNQAMVFSQYTDTMDFLRESLLLDNEWKLMCFSGRGGEVPKGDGTWRVVDRDYVKRRFRNHEADILICTDAAAEGLNFQFCGVVVNYDMPWNPMRVEQRIGRIDRLGQRNATIRIVNLHYEDTVETDIYRALRSRIGLFESVVGNLQPILAQLPRRISGAVLEGESSSTLGRARVVGEIEREANQRRESSFNIDDATQREITTLDLPDPIITMHDLDRIIKSKHLIPNVIVGPLGNREYTMILRGLDNQVRVTTNVDYFQEHAESVELWSPGNPLFVPPEYIQSTDLGPEERSLRDILDSEFE